MNENKWGNIMKYGSINGVNKPASRIVFGTAYAALVSGDQEPEEFGALIETAIDTGINTIDTAKQYGAAQDTVGAWLAHYRQRDQLVIETKGCHPSEDGTSRVTEEDLSNDLLESLDKLHTSYVDVYLLHRDDPSVPAGDIVEWLNAQHRAGRIHAFGGSNWTPKRIQEANDYAAAHDLIPFAVSSPNYSLAVQEDNPWMGDCSTLNGASMAEDRAWYRANQLPMFAYSVLGRGFMTGMFASDDLDTAEQRLDEAARKGYCYPDNFERLRRAEILAARKSASVAQIAIAWVLSQDLNVYALLSCTSPAIIASNVGALAVDLTPEEMRWLNLEE
ncbi:aldo/keto reductase [Bifidobacterium myosotis]|nr:aldo/keto reductase [Bifidobacterium myosotis]